MTKILTLPQQDPETHISLSLGSVLNVQFADDPNGLWYPEGYDSNVLRRNGYSHFTDDPKVREDAFKGVSAGSTVIHYQRDAGGPADRCTVHVTVN